MRDLGEAPGGIHLVNRVFHEAGHVIFRLFGSDFMTVAGGTLNQLLMPAILVVAFLWKNRDAFGSAISLLWFGENLVDCAPYINDARSLDLMVITSGTGKEIEGHDWEYLLTQLGVLNKDVYIAHYVLLTGRVVMILSYIWAVAALTWAIRKRS